MLAKVLISALLAAPASAHLAMWHPSMYGYGDSYEPVTPLSNYLSPKTGSFDQWWFHGAINSPPADGQMMELPAGGTFTGEIACDKGLTSFGGGNSDLACDSDGSLHLANGLDQSNVKGAAISIAYKSDVNLIKPEDFTVISVNYACPYKRECTYQIPKDLPACPEGGCHCQWSWIHGPEGGGDEMYFVGYRCTVTGASASSKPIPAPNVAKKCSGGSDCTVGAKQPLYWAVDQGNIEYTPEQPPYYNAEYGFADGAQNDIWGGNGVVTNNTGASSPPSKSTSSSGGGGAGGAGGHGATKTGSGGSSQQTGASGGGGGGSGGGGSSSDNSDPSGPDNTSDDDSQQWWNGDNTGDSSPSSTTEQYQGHWWDSATSKQQGHHKTRTRTNRPAKTNDGQGYDQVSATATATPTATDTWADGGDNSWSSSTTDGSDRGSATDSWGGDDSATATGSSRPARSGKLHNLAAALPTVTGTGTLAAAPTNGTTAAGTEATPAVVSSAATAPTAKPKCQTRSRKRAAERRAKA